jgi:hypothetical protein
MFSALQRAGSTDEQASNATPVDISALPHCTRRIVGKLMWSADVG